jgi:hypothetical protein
VLAVVERRFPICLHVGRRGFSPGTIACLGKNGRSGNAGKVGLIASAVGCGGQSSIASQAARPPAQLPGSLEQVDPMAAQ